MAKKEQKSKSPASSHAEIMSRQLMLLKEQHRRITKKADWNAIGNVQLICEMMLSHGKEMRTQLQAQGAPGEILSNMDQSIFHWGSLWENCCDYIFLNRQRMDEEEAARKLQEFGSSLTTHHWILSEINKNLDSRQ